MKCPPVACLSDSGLGGEREVTSARGIPGKPSGGCSATLPSLIYFQDEGVRQLGTLKAVPPLYVNSKLIRVVPNARLVQ